MLFLVNEGARQAQGDESFVYLALFCSLILIGSILLTPSQEKKGTSKGAASFTSAAFDFVSPLSFGRFGLALWLLQLAFLRTFLKGSFVKAVVAAFRAPFLFVKSFVNSLSLFFFEGAVAAF